MTSTPPPSDTTGTTATTAEATTARARTPSTGWTALRPRAWNLLLLVPLVVCIPPLFNMTEPRVGGLSFFYWFQLVIIPIGIACTVTVHLVTRGGDEDDR